MKPEFQTDMFDKNAGKQRAETGMDLASSSFRVQKWKMKANEWLFHQKGNEITADDLTKDVGLPSNGENQNNVIGAWFNKKSHENLIFWTGRFQKSSRISRHVGMQRIWRVI